MIDELVLADVYEYAIDRDAIFETNYVLTGSEMLRLTIGESYTGEDDY